MGKLLIHVLNTRLLHSKDHPTKRRQQGQKDKKGNKDDEDDKGITYDKTNSGC